jgi:glucose-1-phosphate thymidylyltransferase
MKGLILSGGKGTRLQPITFTSAKQLVPVANRPVLFYGIQAMADAVLTAEPFLGEDQFVMYLGDNLLQGGITELVRDFERERPDAMILLTPVPDPEHYGVAELHDGRVTSLQEKPPEPKTDLALVGVYLFTACIHDAARAIEPSARGELEITDAIQRLVDDGRRVDPHVVQGWWKDTGRLDDMLEANRLILDTIERRIDGTLTDSSVDGRVVIEEGAVLERSSVRGPAIIGKGARIVDAYVGPYSAIGDRCTIERAEVEHAIMLEGSSVRDLGARMESSLLGREVTIARSLGQPRAYRFLVGDRSDIGIV